MRSLKIAIVDYGIGNHASLLNALNNCEFSARVTKSINIFNESDLLILPGVGSFSPAYTNLVNSGLDQYLKRVSKQKPLLGICLGMQLLCKTSEEGSFSRGLGLIDGKIIKLPDSLKHIGWNNINIKVTDSLFNNFNEQEFYFNHGYHFEGNSSHIIAKASFNCEIASIIKKENIVGIQFHPEKSQKSGHSLLKSIIPRLIDA